MMSLQAGLFVSETLARIEASPDEIRRKLVLGEALQKIYLKGIRDVVKHIEANPSLTPREILESLYAMAGIKRGGDHELHPPDPTPIPREGPP